MAIDMTTNISIVKSEQRTWAINIDAPKGGDYTIAASRENLGLDAQSTVQSRAAAPTVLRLASKLIAGNEAPFVCADGTSITISHLLEAIPGLIDRWAAADAANPPTVP